MQTIWYRTRDEGWLRLTRFFGTLMLINFAIGVATGLVQEFQFGMNWSVYSVYVGDVFGAPLAIEGLAAFMLEATFPGSGSSAGTGSPGASTSQRSGSLRSARGCRRFSSWLRTRGCSGQSAPRSPAAEPS
jgi:hypothetical protein